MNFGNELEQALLGDSAHTRPASILEGISDELAFRPIAGAPHTLYQELWHLAFWTRITLDWCEGHLTPFPADANLPFAANDGESWEALRARFLRDTERAAVLTRSAGEMGRAILCPSRPGEPTRTMSVGDQLVSLAAHNSYHLGRMVLLRQMLGSWPPSSGGFTW